MPDFLAELKWRGLLHQCTNEESLRDHLATGKRRAYVGFDPTADSLTIGNLVPIMLLRHFQLAGHEPVVVMGGGTGLIGDPSGKSAERQLMTRQRVEDNVNAQRRIFEGLLDFADPEPHSGRPRGAVILNNVVWLDQLGFLEVLRDVGKHFSVNMMIQKDSVRERLNSRDQGISFTEFSYMILQSYDYLHLFQHEGVTLQMGGSDQWGNIVAGGDLIHSQRGAEMSRLAASKATAEANGDPDSRRDHELREQAITARWTRPAFGLTAPLVTKSDGGKFGKTETGAIWLTAERTSPYAYYQFWLNAADADVGRFLRIFTLLSRQEIEALEAEHAKDPGARAPHRALAREATRLLHGATEMEHAEKAAKALFSGEVAELPEALLNEVLSAAPATDHDKALLGSGVSLLDLLPQTSLAKSKSEAREFLGSGSVSVNGQKATADKKLSTLDLLHGRLIALRRGKKNWHLTRWN